MTIHRAEPKTIVLVDHDPSSRVSVQDILAGAGFIVVDFPDYQGALAVAESSRRLDLLVTALRLPKGTPHGLSLAAMVRLRRPGLPVLFLADSVDLELTAAEEAPTVTRPIGAEALLAAISQLIGEA